MVYLGRGGGCGGGGNVALQAHAADRLLFNPRCLLLVPCRVSKGTTVLLYSERNWKGRELLIDADASFIGLDMNDRCIRSPHQPSSILSPQPQGLLVVVCQGRGARATREARPSTLRNQPMNARVYSAVVKDEEPVPHSVKIYRVGSSMGVSQEECPASTMCWPATTMPQVRNSVYMGNSRSLYDEVGRRIGCEVVKFVSAEGRRWAIP